MKIVFKNITKLNTLHSTLNTFTINHKCNTLLKFYTADVLYRYNQTPAAPQTKQSNNSSHARAEIIGQFLMYKDNVNGVRLK